MRMCIIMAHLRLMTLSHTVIAACRQASGRPSNVARSCARRDLERNALYCSQLLRNGPVTHPSLWANHSKFEVKRCGASDHSNDCMAVSLGCYAASNFAGSADCLGPEWPSVCGCGALRQAIGCAGGALPTDGSGSMTPTTFNS